MKGCGDAVIVTHTGGTMMFVRGTFIVVVQRCLWICHTAAKTMEVVWKWAAGVLRSFLSAESIIGHNTQTNSPKKTRAARGVILF